MSVHPNGGLFVCLFVRSRIPVICGGSSGGAHRQAAVMALFLTGMINDGALAANGPGETRCYRRHRGKESEGERGRGAEGLRSGLVLDLCA